MYIKRLKRREDEAVPILLRTLYTNPYSFPVCAVASAILWQVFEKVIESRSFTTSSTASSRWSADRVSVRCQWAGRLRQRLCVRHDKDMCSA